MDERFFWLGFSAFPGVGPAKFDLLLETFGTAKNAWEASPVDLKEVLKDTLSSQFETFRKNFSIESYEKQLQAKNVSFLILSDSEYPKLLAVIPNPPFVLYIKGNKSILADTMIGIVGTRKVTSYGREVTEMFAGELTQTGFTIVSGLAMGVDAIAHKATLENDGKTVAVLGCGVDCCFPVENQRLYDAILEKDGVIVSEYPIGTTPNKGTFPSRNRIIAGLSQGVLVTEGAEDSGSLITANYALTFGRKVFAVPGPITSHLSKGPLQLIDKGAKLVTKPEDILKEFQINTNFKYPIPNKKKIVGETKEEQGILDLLGNEPLSFDAIFRQTKLNSATLGSILSMMEVKGLIKQNEQGYFSLVT